MNIIPLGREAMLGLVTAALVEIAALVSFLAGLALLLPSLVPL